MRILRVDTVCTIWGCVCVVCVWQTDVDVRVIKAAVDTAEELFYLPDRKRMLSRLTSVGNGKYLGVFMTKVAATA